MMYLAIRQRKNKQLVIIYISIISSIVSDRYKFSYNQGELVEQYCGTFLKILVYRLDQFQFPILRISFGGYVIRKVSEDWSLLSQLEI
jgi:hypothetical protein